MSKQEQAFPMEGDGLSPHDFVVGIGASADDLEALHLLLDAVPLPSRTAFVLVQSSVSSARLTVDMLSGLSRLPVFEVRSGTRVLPDAVYLVPAGKVMRFEKGLLRTFSTDVRFHPRPLDTLLQSLAAERGSRAAGVVLSAGEGDGALGIRSLREGGGLVFAWGNWAAADTGWTGKVDAVLPPREIAGTLCQLGRAHGADEEPPSLAATEQGLRELFERIKRQSGIDFFSYKRNTVLRRLERRMAMNEFRELTDYLAYIEGNREETEALGRDLLIGVTQFFRDPEAFHILQNESVPELFARLGDRKELRVWVACCSTGEEAYSVAMVLKHYRDEHRPDCAIKIFATDIDKGAIDFASRGCYSESSVQHVPEPFFHKYLIQGEAGSYQVAKEIRRLILFAPHNLIQDPPFRQMDLITCRNMLIYLQAETRDRVLQLFPGVLNEGGYLVLGPSESPGVVTRMFDPVDRRWSVYRRRGGGLHTAGSGAGSAADEPLLPFRLGSLPSLASLQKRRQPDELYAALVEEQFPPALVVDENNEVVHLTGEVTPYLSLAKGRPSWNLYKLMDAQLAVAVATALQAARRDARPISRSLRLNGRPPGQMIRLTVRPLSAKNRTLAGLMLVLFEETANAALAPAVSLPHDGADSRRVAGLERELMEAEERLQEAIVELEASHEELQVTNEELLTANEELQSMNEELLAVNSEHQQKIRELTELNNDMTNFLVSTRIGTVFLDRQLCIRRFTPAITAEIPMLETDRGRPISHLSHNFKYTHLVRDAKKVLGTLVPIEREIQSRTGKWYSMRIQPYRKADQSVDGIVLTFVDITELKSANEELLQLSYAVEQSPGMMVIADLEGRIAYVNPQFTKVTGYSSEEAIGRCLRGLNEWGTSTRPPGEVWLSVLHGQPWEGELESRRKDETVFWEKVRLLPIQDPKGKPMQVLKVSEDITAQKTTEELLRKSEMLSAVGQLAAGIAHEIRNPLTALKGFTKLIASGMNSSNYVTIMDGELNRIEHIVSELLVLAKPQALDFQRKPIVPILQDVIMLLDTQAILSNVEIRTDFAEAVPQVLCVENQLKQVFINILKNALEAIPEGGTVDVGVKVEGDGAVRIHFRDSGVGIPAGKLARLGEPFYSTKDKGTGLGLMVSYKIIETHKGTIRYTSEEGKGTTVAITLPGLP
ncbi:ATPase [Paenibacillus sp. J31TS4]|uniref:CheR family methyltransferase n=1 Tax=Paenibacillus sp. J31TS4 TaxID=2807195 RepID=UPI001B0AA32C|nr:CheR family methyltransferase [Paenibacillus sp. J31TS4]GIP41135.1 ATPase [Paenibacillus sp. J31TS4]